MYFNPRISPREIEPFINSNIASDANVLGMDLTYISSSSDLRQYDEEESKNGR